MSHEVWLRLMDPNDAETVFQIENDAELWDVTTDHGPYSRRVITDFVLNSTGNIAHDGQMRFMIETVDGIVGTLDLTDYDGFQQFAFVGIALKKEYRRRGYAGQAVAQAIDYARKVLSLHKLYALIHKHNTPSLQLFRKANFTETETFPHGYEPPEGLEEVCLLQLFL